MWERIRRWRWALGIAAVLALGLAWSFWPEAVAVDVGEVDRGPMAVGVTDDGVTRIHDVFAVSAPVTGYVTRIELEPGDRVVARDTMIARMAARPSTPLDERSRRELANALAAAQAAGGAAAAQVRSASAALDLARTELHRAEVLAERGFVTEARLDAARADAQSRRAALDAARASVAQSEAEARRIAGLLAEPAAGGPPSGGPIAVRSPTSGVLLRRLVESEGVVAEGTPLVEIGDPAQVEVVIDLLSREAVQISPGDPVEITRWGGERPLPGRVRRIEPYGRLKISALGIEEQRVNVIIDFAPEAAQQIAGLGHGYQVDATILLWREAEVLRLPIGALFRGGDGGWRVFAVEGGRARERAVTVGHISEDHAELLGGLEAGARVILNPGGSVAEGVRVRPRTR